MGTVTRTMEMEDWQDSVVQAVLAVPRNDWDKLVSELSSSKLSQMSDFALGLSAIFAEYAEYVDYRGGAACGDHGHDAAMSAAQKRRKKVRKALGYAYP